MILRQVAHRPFVVAEIVLQPAHRIEIEVVGRFGQQQGRRVAEQRLRRQDDNFLAPCNSPILCVSNLAKTLECLKEANFWIVGLDERGEEPYYEADFCGRCVFVAGGEEKGLPELIKK